MIHILNMRLPIFIRSYLISLFQKSRNTHKLYAILSSFTDKMLRLIEWIQSFRIVITLYQKIQNICISVLSTGSVPEHVSFIMDGNRRFAKKSGMAVKGGHEAGGLTLLSVCYACKKIGVKCVSAYAFSIENFNRAPDEVETLLKLFAGKLDEFASRAADYRDPLYGSRLKVIGDHSLVNEDMRTKIKNVENLTKDGDIFTLYICFPYTSRNDIAHSILQLATKYTNNEIQTKDFSIKNVTENMYLDQFSDKCDLLIRTSGRMRFSDYMLWQVHQGSTIAFVPTLWPDFNFAQLYWIVLRWSFFNVLRETATNRLSFKDRMFHRMHLVKRLGKRDISIYDSLPEPPICISITGEVD